MGFDDQGEILGCIFKNLIPIVLINKLLYPFAWLYESVISVRNVFYSIGIFKSSEFDVPIINVGNISAGGNGKTPQVEYLVELLKDNYQVAVLSRGYGRKSKGFFEVDASSSSREMGDEPLQIKRKFKQDALVFVGENRVEAITKTMFKHPAIQVIILDDAFQHRAVKAGMNLLLTDYNHLFINDYLLPVGRLRENKNGAARADAIVVTKCPSELSMEKRNEIRQKLQIYTSQVVFSSLSYGKIYPVLNIPNDKSSGSKENFLLVTGIAKPLLLEKYIKSNFNLKDKITFSDHHSFTNFDIVAIEKKISNFADQNLEVLTTEKDAVRFLDYYNHRRTFGFGVKALPVKPLFFGDDKSTFDQLIDNYVRENSTDS